MKKAFVFVLIALLMLMFAGCAGGSEQDPEALGETENEKAAAYADGCYDGLPSTFSEMEEAADLIVKARAVSDHSKWEGVTKTTVFEVDNVIKGECGETIELNQLDQDGAVEIGKEYVLFLKPMDPNDIEKYGYYDVGGYYGAFEIDEAARSLIVREDFLKCDELNEWIAKTLVPIGLDLGVK